MIRIVLFAVASVSLTTVANAQTSAQIQSGMKVYETERCSICHAIGGKGNQKGPLDDVGSRLSTDEIRMWMVDAPGMTAKTKSTRKPLMRSYPKIAADDLDALVAYLASLKK
jgi:mono/diheme cytochrome c family protein